MRLRAVGMLRCRLRKLGSATMAEYQHILMYNPITAPDDVGSTWDDRLTDFGIFLDL